MVGPFCTNHSICLNIGFWYSIDGIDGIDAFSILVYSTKKRYSNFLKKVFVFQKICLKVKVLKTFEISSDCHLKIGRPLKRRAILKTLVLFLEEPLLFLFALKWNLSEKSFSSVKTKNNPNFGVKLCWKDNLFIFTVYW